MNKQTKPPVVRIPGTRAEPVPPQKLWDALGAEPVPPEEGHTAEEYVLRQGKKRLAADS